MLRRACIGRFCMNTPRTAHRHYSSAMTTSSKINAQAQVGFTKSNVYDQYRPSYSPSIVQLLLEKLRVAGKRNATVLDLGAGTGKFTEALASRDEDFRVIAVEPHEDMRRVLDEKKLHGVSVKDGTATSIPADDESVDAVICAQVGHHLIAGCSTSRTKSSPFHTEIRTSR